MQMVANGKIMLMDMIEVPFMAIAFVGFIVMLMRFIFLPISFPLIIGLIALSIFFNAGAVYITRLAISTSRFTEANPFRKGDINKKSGYVIGPLAIICAIILIGIVMDVAVADFSIVIAIVTGLDFLHDFRVYYSENKTIKRKSIEEVE